MKLKRLLVFAFMFVICFAGTAYASSADFDYDAFKAQHKYVESIANSSYLAVSETGEPNSKALFDENKQLTEYKYDSISPVVLENEFESQSYFRYKYIIVSQKTDSGEKYGLLSLTEDGKEVLPLEYAMIKHVSPLDLYAVSKGNGNNSALFYDDAKDEEKGKFISGFEYADFQFAPYGVIACKETVNGRRFGLLSIDGSEEYLPVKYRGIDFTLSKDKKTAYFAITSESGKKALYIDGLFFTKFLYDKIECYEDVLIEERTENGEKFYDLLKASDLTPFTGKTYSDFKITESYTAIVAQKTDAGQLYGAISLADGTEEVPLEYKSLESLGSTYYAASRTGEPNSKALFDNTTPVSDFIYENISMSPGFSKIAVVSQIKDGKECFGIISGENTDDQFKVVLPLEYKSVEVVETPSSEKFKAESFDGSVEYLASETIDGDSYTKKGDMYSVALTDEQAAQTTRNRIPIKGWEGHFLDTSVAMDEYYVSADTIVDEAGNSIATYDYVDYKISPGDTLVVGSLMGHYDIQYHVINKNLETIASGDYKKPEFYAGNGKTYIKFDDTYLDLQGHLVENPITTDMELITMGGEISNEAYKDVFAALENEMVPYSLQCNYSSAITRKDFCQLVMTLYSKKTGSSVDTKAASPFSDINDPYVTAANKLGLITAASDKKFNPYGNITRQEAAVMLANTAKALGINISARNTSKYSDERYFAQWAKDAIYAMTALKSGNSTVMTEKEKNKFSPWMNVTKEDMIASLWKLYNA